MRRGLSLTLIGRGYFGKHGRGCAEVQRVLQLLAPHVRRSNPIRVRVRVRVRVEEWLDQFTWPSQAQYMVQG